MSTLNEQERIDRLVRDVVATLGPRFDWWYCERDRTPIVRLGELQALGDD